MQTREAVPATTATKQPAVAARDIVKRYGSFQALSGASLEVPSGAIYGLLGPNGAGKTTLIKLLVGASRPTSGEVRVLDLDPVRQASAVRRQIGYMPQAPALYDDLSARDNVRFFAQAHDLPDLGTAVDETLEFVALADRAQDTVYSFSGGMKQRVSLACALVHKPRVLFLDEPTAGVDPKLKEGFWRHFHDLASQGVTIFLSTHLMDEALLCDRLTILRAGKVLITAPPRDIMQRGHTTLRIWRGGSEDVEVVQHYFTELPGVLRAYGLDPAVTRIELDEEPLETIIVRMVEEEPN